MALSLMEMFRTLEENQKRYRMLFESAGDAIFMLEAEGENVGRIVSANRAAAVMHGYSVEELVGMQIQDLETPESAAGNPERIRRIMSGEWIDAEISHRKKDGSVFPVEISAGMLEFEDQKYILAFDKDITERKQAEEALQRTEQLVVVGEMAAGLAHEIKNPLAGIKLSIEILSAELNLAKDDEELFQRIVAEINRIETLLKNLLSYAKPPIPQFAPIDVNRIIEAAVKAAKYSLKGHAQGEKSRQPKAIEFVKDLNDLPLIVADAAQLQQVILNLLLNAVHAVHDRGTIRLATSAKVDDSIQIVVSDNGKGILESGLEKIFLPFFTTKPKGTGLGLSICKRLIEQQNGTIGVARNPEGGLTFTIHLPIEQVSEVGA
jgi:two-component system sensor histidine kinase AtoS